MGTSEVETIKEIQGRENIFVAYSQTTKLPYVTCGEESFNDQAWFFTEEEAIKEFGKKKVEEKILLMGMRYEKKDFPKMYGLLFCHRCKHDHLERWRMSRWRSILKRS